ncbi:MAG: hypothetical protein KGL39_06890 [Patescibacteria group bacterium]|nr:hypothetical protein [Patescibacteria group bacterium]
MPYLPIGAEPFQEGLPELDLADEVARGWVVLIANPKGYDLEQPRLGAAVIGTQVWSLDARNPTHTWNDHEVHVRIHMRPA